MMPENHPQLPTPPGARFIAGAMGFVFGGIGLTVLIFLWSAPFGAFHSPPLFFRIFGSFIAIAFVAMGGAAAFGAITGRGMKHSAQRFGRHTGAGSLPAPGGGYRCPRCGAPLSKDAEVSPSGDVKCGFCQAWFNIHRALS